MNRIFRLLLIISAVIAVSSCRPEHGRASLSTVSYAFATQLPDGLTDLSILGEGVHLTNKATGVDTRCTSLDSIVVTVGLCDISYTMECTFTLHGIQTRGWLVSRLADASIMEQESGRAAQLLLPLRVVLQVDDFVVREIFFTGTLTPAGKQYHGDDYVVLYNETDYTLYADGMAFCENRSVSMRKYDYRPDIRHEAMAVQATYVVPGNGKDAVVPPGGRLILCDTGIDHKTNNPNFFDLSKANSEWYDISTVSAHQDFDSPLIPNLDKWFCYTKSSFALHDRGFRSYVIARVSIDIDKKSYLGDYVYKFTWVLTHARASYGMSGSCYKIPNDWILDGINCSVEANTQRTILPEMMDAGYASCGKVDHQKDRYSHSVRHKFLGLNALGNSILQDTDDSTEDFNPMVTPALVKEQGSVIDAKDTPYTTKTYDGVTPMVAK